MRRFFYIVLFLAFYALPSQTNGISTDILIAEREYLKVDTVDPILPEKQSEKLVQTKRNIGWNFSRWYEARRAEAKLLPASERRQYIKQVSVKLTDSILNIRRFSFESNTGTQFGNISKHYLRGSLKLYDSVLSCSFERPLLFWSKQFDYKVVSHSNKKIEIEILVHSASTLERSTINVSQSPYEFLVKLIVYPNREAELKICSIDGMSTHLRSYGFIEPLGDEMF